MSRNLFFVVSHSCSVRLTSKIQVNFRFCRNSRVLTIGSYGFSYFFVLDVFEGDVSISIGMGREKHCVHIHVSDNREQCLTPKIISCLSMSTIRRSSVTIKAVCVHFM